MIQSNVENRGYIHISERPAHRRIVVILIFQSMDGSTKWQCIHNALRFEIFEIVRVIPRTLLYNLVFESCIQGSGV